MLHYMRVERLLLAKISVGQVRHFADPTSLISTYVKGALRTDPVNVLPKSKYGGINTVTLLTGSNLIGKQGAKFVNALLQSTQVPVESQNIDAGHTDDYFNSVLRNRAAVHVDIVCDAEQKQKAMKMNNDLDLYLFKTHTRSFPGFNCRFPDVDIQIIGQNNTGIYSELEYSPVKGVVEAISVCTEETNKKYLNGAFASAVQADRKRVTLVNKAREWPVVDGALVDCAKSIHDEYKDDLELEFMEMEDCIVRLITEPQHFDCIFASDRYATFLATICSGICGGATLFSAVEMGDSHAVFKPLQTKLSLTNYPMLSPYGIVSTIVDLFAYLGHDRCAESLWCELIRTMDEGIKTKEFGGNDTGEYVICNIVNQLRCRGLKSN
ncbi:hypothetical protein KR009_004429 [Drosophila setifemur]|nr:hypothetical protein KR009_004429 [Drosophila setifemur]